MPEAVYMSLDALNAATLGEYTLNEISEIRRGIGV